MPAPSHTAKAVRTLAAALALLAAPVAWSQGDAPASAVENSALDGPLFYQLLLGELELRAGEAGDAYQLMLDAARKHHSEQLYLRATEIALQARAGNQALEAVRAWRADLPKSLQAVQYEVQLLVALNRGDELVDPLQDQLKLTPTEDLPGLISALPRLLGHMSDKARASRVLEQAIRPWLGLPETRTAARVALGQSRLNAGDTARALELARSAQEDDPAADGPALLALALMPTTPDAEALVTAHLASHPDSTRVRLAYSQVLAAAQRYGDAIVQLQRVSRDEPDRAATWLSLGAMQLELRHPDEATTALQRYLQLAKATPPVPTPHPGGAVVIENVGGSDATTSAYLMLSHAAEQRGDLDGAAAWLDKVDDPQRALEVQSRRASLLARQGKLDEARELIRRVPASDAAGERAKVLAEAQLLREARKWHDAEAVLAAANRRFPNDTGLLYEQAMIEEKLDRMDEMERLLRRVIQLAPDHQHAYNALGYSLADRGIRLPEARALIEKALSLAPGEPFITDSLGWVAYREGKIDEALRLLRRAYRSRPDPEIAAHLGEVLWVDGRHDEARQVWREGQRRDTDNPVLRETLARLRVDL